MTSKEQIFNVVNQLRGKLNQSNTAETQESALQLDL